MDHHCPWLNTCVGHGNYAHFVRFLGSVFVTINIVFALIAIRIFDLLTYQKDIQKYYSGSIQNMDIRYSPAIDGMQLVVVVATILVCAILEFTVGILFLWHLYYIAQNISTIEDHENSAIQGLIKREIIPKGVKYPYDLGIYNNFKQVFGGELYVWWIPGMVSLGSGLEYPVSNQTPWPPREYYLYKKYPYGKPSKQERKQGNRYPRVRRGSEGYIIPTITADDREKMVSGLLAHEDTVVASAEREPLRLDAGSGTVHDDVSSTDYDSLDDDFEDENISAAENSPAKDESSDDEVLGLRQKRL